MIIYLHHDVQSGAAAKVQMLTNAYGCILKKAFMVNISTATVTRRDARNVQMPCFPPRHAVPWRIREREGAVASPQLQEIDLSGGFQDAERTDEYNEHRERTAIP